MKIGLRILLGYFLIVALAALLLGQVFLQQVKPGVRMAVEDSLVDTANLLASLAGDEVAAGTITEGNFALNVLRVHERDFGARIAAFDKNNLTTRVMVTNARGIVLFDSAGEALGEDHSRWNDVYLTLQGRYGARSTRADPNDDTSSVMHVAAPILHPVSQELIGVLTVARPNQTFAPFIDHSQRIILGWGGVLLGTALLVGLFAATWLSRQIDALRQYAEAVRLGERATLPASAGEFAELGRALQAMREQLEGKQYVERYVQTLTHELKSPLAAIRGSAELLAQDAAEATMSPRERAGFIASIETQGARITAMVDKLLALAEVEQRRQLDAPQQVDLRALCSEAAAQSMPHGKLRDVAITLAQGDALGVRGDAFLLRQAVQNLIDNALDFAPPGSTIELSVVAGRNEVTLTVADRGPGIPDYALPRVFERFYSLPRPAGGSRSSGIGLCFVAEVATLHGGSAALTNRDGGGALATLALPKA